MRLSTKSTYGVRAMTVEDIDLTLEAVERITKPKLAEGLSGMGVGRGATGHLAESSIPGEVM